MPSDESVDSLVPSKRISVRTPLVSIIVPCRNERGYIGKCLESILANDYPADRIEVLVVDGVSDDGTREVLEEYTQRWPHVRWLDNPGRTAPSALNIGIREAGGDIVMRMDAHCRYPDNYISALVGWLDLSGADNVGGVCRTLPGADTLTACAIALALSHPFGVGNSHFRIGTSTAKWVDTVPFGCYKKSVFQEIGLFDEELSKNQDDEFNQRLLGNGGRILLVPGIMVDYFARDSIGKVCRMYYRYGYYKPLVARKLGRIGTFRQVIPAVFLGSLAVSALLSPWLSIARWALTAILGSYLVALLTAVVSATTGKTELSTAALLGVVFPAIHFSYGWGTIRGVIRFLLLRRPAPLNASEVSVSR